MTPKERGGPCPDEAVVLEKEGLTQGGGLPELEFGEVGDSELLPGAHAAQGAENERLPFREEEHRRGAGVVHLRCHGWGWDWGWGVRNRVMVRVRVRVMVISSVQAKAYGKGKSDS